MPIPGSSVAQVGVAHSRSSAQACWIMHPNFLIAGVHSPGDLIRKVFSSFMYWEQYCLCPSFCSPSETLLFSLWTWLYLPRERLEGTPFSYCASDVLPPVHISISFLSSPWYPRCMHTLPAHAHTHTVSCTHKYKATIKSSSLSQNKTISFSPKHTSVHINIWHQCPPNDWKTASANRKTALSLHNLRWHGLSRLSEKSSHPWVKDEVAFHGLCASGKLLGPFQIHIWGFVTAIKF